MAGVSRQGVAQPNVNTNVEAIDEYRTRGVGIAWLFSGTYDDHCGPKHLSIIQPAGFNR